MDTHLFTMGALVVGILMGALLEVANKTIKAKRNGLVEDKERQLLRYVADIQNYKQGATTVSVIIDGRVEFTKGNFFQLTGHAVDEETFTNHCLKRLKGTHPDWQIVKVSQINDESWKLDWVE
jgi:hypothetical protein